MIVTTEASIFTTDSGYMWGRILLSHKYSEHILKYVSFIMSIVSYGYSVVN